MGINRKDKKYANLLGTGGFENSNDFSLVLLDGTIERCAPLGLVVDVDFGIKKCSHE